MPNRIPTSPEPLHPVHDHFGLRLAKGMPGLKISLVRSLVTSSHLICDLAAWKADTQASEAPSHLNKRRWDTEDIGCTAKATAHCPKLPE